MLKHLIQQIYNWQLTVDGHRALALRTAQFVAGNHAIRAGVTEFTLLDNELSNAILTADVILSARANWFVVLKPFNGRFGVTKVNGAL